MNQAAAGDSTDEPRVATSPRAGVAEPIGEQVQQAEAAAAANAAPAPDTPAPVIEAALSEAHHSASALRAAAIAEHDGTAPAHPVEAPPTVPTPASEEKAQAADAEPSSVPVEDTHKAVTPEQVAPVEHGIGVLLVNLGTPDAAERKAVHRYLKEFLSDRRVIERNSLLWQAVLRGVILPLRSRRRARDYHKIWNHEKSESPFKTISRSQAEKLAAALEPLGKHVIVDWAMRYASPSIRLRLEALIRRGCDRILIMPLYPQYSAATTATACDEVYRYMMSLRVQPALRILPAYYEEPHYIEALASSLEEQRKELRFEPDVILVSYHGMPREYVDKGDPYERQCARTTELLRQRLGLDEHKLMMSFQSRFGRGLWLEPYTIKTVRALAKKGVKNLVVITPGFSADCLETLEEIAVENARVFKRHGGKNFAVIRCLNDSETGMLMIRELAMRELKGWVDTERK
jgi:ferrochelatase